MPRWWSKGGKNENKEYIVYIREVDNTTKRIYKGDPTAYIKGNHIAKRSYLFTASGTLYIVNQIILNCQNNKTLDYSSFSEA